MEQILQTDAHTLEDVIYFELDREDLTGYTLGGQTLNPLVPYKPSWENNGEFFFQKLGRGEGGEGGDSQTAGAMQANARNGLAILNGDFGGLLPSEVDPFIDALLAGGLIFQAFHQHFTDIQPQELYYMHFRGIGDPLQLAQAVINAVKVTGTPLPQFQSSPPTTPLPVQQLSQILGGPADVGGDGVVTVYVPRRDRVVLGGVPISPFLNVATNISFEPLDNSGATVAAAPNFSMVASEIQNVMRVMRGQGWVIGCLYNQETAEYPQLYFSHQVKVGDPITLAREIRNGLDQTNSAGSS